MADFYPIQHHQRKQIFALLSNLNLTAQRSNIVAGFTQSGSMKDMSYHEAMQLIKYLNTQKKDLAKKAFDVKNQKRRKIIAISYGIPEHFEFWHWQQERKIFNQKGLNEWLLNSKKSPFKKTLNELSSSELSKLITVFETIKKYYNK